MFSFIRNCQILFQSCCIILHSHKQLWVIQFIHIHTRMRVLTLFFILSILVGMEWYLVIFIFISLLLTMFKILSCTLTSAYFLWWNVCSLLLPIFHLYFSLMSYESSLHILDTGPLSDTWFKNIFSVYAFFFSSP